MVKLMEVQKDKKIMSLEERLSISEQNSKDKTQKLGKKEETICKMDKNITDLYK